MDENVVNENAVKNKTLIDAENKAKGGVFPDEVFLAATEEEKRSVEVMGETVGYWKDAMRRFRRNKVAMTAFVVLIIIFLMAIIQPIVTSYPYDKVSYAREEMNQGPTWAHPFGTDHQGRDLLTRTMYGTRISLSIGVVGAVLVLIIGAIYGAISGYLGGIVDIVMMRIVDVIMSVPVLLLIILLRVVLADPLRNLFENVSWLGGLAALGVGMISLFIVIGIFSWTGMARLVRGQVLSLKTQEYVLAAEMLGAKNSRIILKHLVPNCIGVIVVSTMLQIPALIFLEAFLSFIGMGIVMPMASLGSLCETALGGMTQYPYKLFFPAAMLSLILLAFNLFGDGLRDALDPRLRK